MRIPAIPGKDRSPEARWWSASGWACPGRDQPGRSPTGLLLRGDLVAEALVDLLQRLLGHIDRLLDLRRVVGEDAFVLQLRLLHADALLQLGQRVVEAGDARVIDLDVVAG